MHLYVLDWLSRVQLAKLAFKLGQIKFTSQFLVVLSENKIEPSNSTWFSVDSVPNTYKIDIAKSRLIFILDKILSVRGEHKNAVIS